MKGNQGLEALAALCGGRPAVEAGSAPSADAATSSGDGTGTAPSTPSRASPQGATVSSPVAAKATTSAGIAGASAAEEITKQIQQQATAGAALPVGTDPSTVPGAPSAGGLTPQQLQAMFATNGRLDPALAAQSLLYPTALRGVETVATPAPISMIPASANNILASTMQQLALQQYLQAQTNAAQQQQQAQAAQAAATVAATTGHPQAALLAMTLAGKTGQLLPTAAPTPTMAVATNTNTGGNADPHRSSQQASAGAQQQVQAAQAQALLQQAAQQQQFNPANFATIKPAKAGIHQHAQALQQQYHFPNNAPVAAGTASTLPSMIKMATAAGGRILPSTDITSQNPLGTKSDGGDSPGSKKQQKRAANRRSAQLSRKRKKQFIEELKEENDDLKRKEQILRAIPDLIVVFDSSGRLGFVSESVGRFLDVSPDKMVGTSFWDLICEESVRMLKAAFMDSLAAREVDSDTAMLGSDVWQLRLKDKNSKYTNVALNGVVHFKGDAPECVCCIRPLSEEKLLKKQTEQQGQAKKQKQLPQLKSDGSENSNNAENLDGAEKANKNNVNRAVSCSDGDASRSSDGSNRTQSILNMSSAQQDEAAVDAKKRSKKFRRVMASAADGDSSSNNDSDNSNNVEGDGTNNSIRISDGDSNDGIESD